MNCLNSVMKQHGIAEERQHGIAEERQHGIAEERQHGIAEERQHGIAEERQHGIAEERQHGIAEERQHGIAEESGSHTRKSYTKDLHKVVKELADAKLWQEASLLPHIFQEYYTYTP